jgi:hypothetical protein
VLNNGGVNLGVLSHGRRWPDRRSALWLLLRLLLWWRLLLALGLRLGWSHALHRPLKCLRLFLLDLALRLLCAWVTLARLALGALLLLLLHLHLAMLSLARDELLRVLEELLARCRVLRRAGGVLLCHVPEVHHDLAVLLPLVLGKTLQPQNVVGSHRLRGLAASRLLRLWLGLRVGHCRDLEQAPNRLRPRT